jgi:RHH-type rel operon transcriptional repressor/antitoxin RelB
MSAALSVRLPEKLANELERVSKETERPKSFHIQKALELYLEAQADMQIALDRYHDSMDPIITSHDIRDQLGL